MDDHASDLFLSSGILFPIIFTNSVNREQIQRAHDLVDRMAVEGKRRPAALGTALNEDQFKFFHKMLDNPKIPRAVGT